MTPTWQEAAIQKWIRTVLSIRAPLARQAAPRPQLPYATVLVLGDTALGATPDSDVTDEVMGEGVKRVISHPREGTASIQIYGEGAADRLQTLELSLGNPSVRQALKDDGLVISHVKVGHTHTLELLDTSFERRAGADFVFRYIRKLEHETPYVETATFSGGLT